MPCLLLKGGSLVKTIKFKSPNYVGDPINAIRIYNEKEVDELIVLDITATVEGRRPSFSLIKEIASECFMPVTYGGGIREIEEIKQILNLGIEKISLNSYAIENPSFIRVAAQRFGNQSVVVSMDVKKNWRGRFEVYTQRGQKSTGLDPVKFAQEVEELGAGEILVTAVDRDGTMEGYDLPLIKKITDAVNVPVIASGGAGKIEDFGAAVKEGGASAVAAGSMVVYHGRNRAVLISFPSRDDLLKVLE